jgi:hypothetical protein
MPSPGPNPPALRLPTVPIPGEGQDEETLEERLEQYRKRNEERKRWPEFTK